MKLSHTSKIAVAAMSALGVAILSYTTHATAQTPPMMLVAQAPSVAIANGSFVAAEKPTTGTAMIIRENGHNYLILDSAFATSDQGPDLHVLLDSATQPPAQYGADNSGRYVNLGQLSSYSGTQRYPIPDTINLADYRSVVIWCRMANATFGYAPLQVQRNATTIR